MNFSNETYKQRAMNIVETNNIISSVDAFLLLIKSDLESNIDPADLENLCEKMQSCYYNYLNNQGEITIERCYNITQNENLSSDTKKTIFYLAQQCIKEGKHLGRKTILDGKINTSSWISHAMNMGETCAILAKELGLDEDKARALGILHDYGRKYNHTFDHVIIGFEKLSDLGLNNEAISCLTHSFVNGGRCSNNEPALEGFYVDENGNPRWKDSVEKDDMTLFLEKYKYSAYDLILNIADLMATDKGIVSPYDRIADIATRRKIDPTNRAYFLADISNLLVDYLMTINSNTQNLTKIKATKDVSLEEIERHFKIVSYTFYNTFLVLNKKNTETKTR